MSLYPNALFCEGAAHSGNKIQYCLACRFKVLTKQGEMLRRAREPDQRQQQQGAHEAPIVLEPNVVFIDEPYDATVKPLTGCQLSAASKRKGHLEIAHGIAAGGEKFNAAVKVVEKRRAERSAFEKRQQHPNVAAQLPHQKIFLQTTWDQISANNSANLTAVQLATRQAEQRLLRTIASRGEAFCCVEDPFFREMLADGRGPAFKMPIANGEKVAEKMREYAEQSRKELFAFMSQLAEAKQKPLAVSLLSDSATVMLGRYVAIVIAFDEHAVLVGMTGDDDLDFDGQLTAEKLSKHFNSFVVLLREHRIHVGSIVTDGGSNFRGAAYSQKDCFAIHCVAHVGNLMLRKMCDPNDQESAFGAILKIAKQLHTENNLPKTSELHDIRWGSAVRLLQAVLADEKKAADFVAYAAVRKMNLLVTQSANVKQAIHFMKPILDVINVAQSDSNNSLIAVFEAFGAAYRAINCAGFNAAVADKVRTVFNQELINNFMCDVVIIGLVYSNCIAV